jgi:hypothetical protein
MTMMTLTQSGQPVSGGFRVDVSRGERVGRVSSEWFSRPDDERYLSLPDLHDAVRRRAERAQTRTVETRAVTVEASRDNAERLALMCRDAANRLHRRIGVLGSCAALSARRRLICVSFPLRWPGSTCNTVCCHTVVSW